MSSRRADPVVARDGDLVVERDPRRPTGRLLRQDDMDASYVDLADPRHLEFDYLRWARIVLEATRARRVLHIGGAGCALPRALAAADPSSRQEVAEVDARVLELARAHLGLRRAPGLRVRVEEGRAALEARADGAYDAIVVDAFVGARVPERLITAEALAHAARVAPLTLVNVVDTRTLGDTRAIAAGLLEAYPHAAAVGARALRGGNVVLLGSASPIPLDRIRPRSAADPSPAAVIAQSELTRLASGTSPLHDRT